MLRPHPSSPAGGQLLAWLARRFRRAIPTSPSPTNSARCLAIRAVRHTVFPARQQPALAPWRLVLVSILQFADGLWLIGKPLMLCAAALTGSTSCASR